MLNKKIFITGATGFIGKNLLSKFSNSYYFKIHNRGDEISISEDIVIHLAGKAHDIKNAINPDEYYEINTELTKLVFDKFLNSNAKIFITISSIKAVADASTSEITEDIIANPSSHYGKSKLLADNYILNQVIPKGKQVYILRPSMVHGPMNKGNLNLLFKLISTGIPWPLGSFNNLRSYCSIDNLLFIINELINQADVPSGIYNVADDVPLSTNNVILLIGKSINKNPLIIPFPKPLVKLFAKLGDRLNLPFNTDKLTKLTETYIVSNKKILKALDKKLPLSSIDGLFQTFYSFKK